MVILNHSEIKSKIKRLAYQILEEYIDEKAVYIFGINNNGKKLRDELIKEIKGIEPKFKTYPYIINLSPADPLSSPINIDMDISQLHEKCVLVIDDVASTGRTLFFAIAEFKEILAKSVKVGVLVDRKHKSFPIKVDFVGRSLATTINDNILVDLSSENDWWASLN